MGVLGRGFHARPRREPGWYLAHAQGDAAADGCAPERCHRCNVLGRGSRRRRRAAAYVASKHGVVGLVRSIAASVASAGVRVNALCPGMADTAMLERLTEAEPA